jgi:hypothetical protein
MQIDWQAISVIAISVGVAALLLLAVAGWRAAVAWADRQYALATTDQLLEMRQWAAVAVGAAEQVLAQATGQEKLEFVLSTLDKVFPQIDADLVRAIVEDSVRDMKVYRLSPSPIPHPKN